MKNYIGVLLLSYFFVAALVYPLRAQDPQRFKKEVDALTANDKAITNKNDVVLFTGSSSIRMWTDLQSDFPKYNVLNRGFGGSETVDLIYYIDRLIVPYAPVKIFIYEGDNDLAAGKSPEQILSSTNTLLEKIRKSLPEEVPVLFISPKPSLARWKLKEKYEKYNHDLAEWAAKQKNVTFINVWNPLLDEHGEVMKDIFREDGLHLNKKGYAIWKKEIGKYLP